MDSTTDGLLKGPPWVEYRARLDLLGQPEQDARVAMARQAMLAHPQVQALVSEVAQWPWPVLTNHKSAGHPLHKLAFLADLGLRADDPGMPAIVSHILEHHSPEGPFQLLLNIPVHFGGSGNDQWCWSLCDAPVTLYALLRLGLGSDLRVQRAIQHLAGLVRDNGWPCAGSRELGRFRGPGRKGDPCPYANLVMLRALAQAPEWRDSSAAHTGAEAQLALWAHSRDEHPYLFHAGTDFRKLKAPFVWYDLLHVLEVLTQFPWLRQDARLHGMIAVLQEKRDAQGRFTAESVWKAWEGWEFGQKKQPSWWLTLTADRILGRQRQDVQATKRPLT
jgi:hypothetical protein